MAIHKHRRPLLQNQQKPTKVAILVKHSERIINLRQKCFWRKKKGISTLMFDFSVFFFGWFWFERTNTEIAIKRFLPILLSRPRGTKKKLAVVEFEIRIGRERDKNSKQHVFLENILTKVIIH